MPLSESDAEQEVAEVERLFTGLGGTFVTAADELAARLHTIHGLLCDWDGVFNAGTKGHGVSSTFDEPDSMGLNLLRFGFWRRQQTLPVAALISGADNPSLQRFAEREHWHAFVCGTKNKVAALEQVCTDFDADPGAMLWVFDDVNDLDVAARCGIRVMIRREASPMLVRHVVRHGLCDYITGLTSGKGAVREVAELCLGLAGTFDDAVRSRMAWDQDYARYFEMRQAIEPRRLGSR